MDKFYIGFSTVIRLQVLTKSILIYIHHAIKNLFLT